MNPYSLCLFPLLEYLMLVRDLIDEVGISKKEAVKYLFNPRDMEIILNIPLVPSLLDDILVWHYTKDGYFYVKSTYYQLGMNHMDRKEGGRGRPQSS